ncbi:MAG TPA: FAD-dependent thymidylate synthase [Acidimicrobiales bacterium]|jgi:thymidylate synthase ThyX|nr:FAD-dependent thymidylate synthase [Acidimicrobiales bacterium]
MANVDEGIYAVEEWTDDEADILRRYFTNLDGPVFALVNLPEVVKGALFARYSRSAKSLRRLFLDEFVGDLDISGDLGIDATIGLARAEQLYDRVFFEYGDDSVAQLGGVHLACEQASNVLTKVLEWGRLMSYMEKSTRYVAYDTRLNGRYRYYRDPEILGSPLGTRYVGDMDRLFDAYAQLLPQLQEYYSGRHPKAEGDSDFVWRQSVRAKAFDALRGMLPSGAISNLGIYASGQAYEALLIRMRAHPLPEARAYADLILEELRKVIPSWVKRVDVDDRGVAHSEYLESTGSAMQDLAHRLFTPDDAVGRAAAGGSPEVELTGWDPDGEVKVVAAMLYPYTDRPESAVQARVAAMSVDDRMEVVRHYVGDRRNRRHRPGRALERCDYRFDVISDYGAFRDLQRHRLLTVEWQDLTPAHGYTMPASVVEAGVEDAYSAAMQRSAGLWEALADRFQPSQAAYAVALAFRIRYVMQFNAREAMHLLELRTSPQGHPEYRQVCQQMHRLIAERAGHRTIAAMMSHVDETDYDSAGLERLQGERRAEARRSDRAPTPS